MFVEHSLKHFHPSLNIGVEDIRNVWLLGDPPVRLPVSLHRGYLHIDYLAPVNASAIAH